MKICPTCRKTYTDDDLNFCLDDGSVLTFASANQPETVLMTQPRPTDPSPQFGSQPGVQASWQNQPQYSMQPKKSSKAWLWVLVIFGALILLCGGGFAAFFVYVASQANTNSARTTPPPPPPRSPGSSPVPTASPTPFSTASTDSIDLSQWVKDFSVYGTTEFKDNEFIMGSKQKGFYYVLVAPSEYTTESATTRVTTRNIDDAPTSLGYGLIVHSDPSPLTKDYAFLIDSKKKRYRVVRHEPEKEVPVVAWTSSTAIKEGSQENVLETRDKNGNIEFYVNGQLLTSVKNTHGYKGGVAGLYSGDGVKIGFKKMEISR